MSILGLVAFSLIRFHVVWQVARFHGHSMLSVVVDVKTASEGPEGLGGLLKVGDLVHSFLPISNSAGDTFMPLMGVSRNSSKARNAS